MITAISNSISVIMLFVLAPSFNIYSCHCNNDTMDTQSAAFFCFFAVCWYLTFERRCYCALAADWGNYAIHSVVITILLFLERERRQ